jgi:hypothetical protein
MARPRKHDSERRSARSEQRYTVAEMAYIRQQADLAGLSVTEYIRRRAVGYQVTHAVPSPSFNASLVSELNRIGVNVNQLAKSVHLDTGFQSYWKEIGEELSAIIASIVSADDS